MKRNVILLTLLLALAAGRSPAYQEVVKKVKCPLCGAPVSGTVVTNATRTALRLDLKPIGDLPVPNALLVCPGCSFVLFRDHLNPALKDSLNCFVKSEAYRNEAAGNTSYYLLGRIGEFRKLPDKDIAYTYLCASWQTEDDTARYFRYLELARQFYARGRAGSRDSTNEEYVSLCLQECEMLRLLGRFDQAQEVIDKMKRNYMLNLKDYSQAIELETRLISGKNGRPCQMDWKKEKAELVNYEDQVYGLPGFDQMQAGFEMDSLFFGSMDNDVRFFSSWLNGGTITYSKSFLVAMLHPLDPVLPNRTCWYIDYYRYRLVPDWRDFLRIQQEIGAKAGGLEWLRQWQQADSGKVVEARFQGKKLNAVSQSDRENVKAAWAHARLKGSPDYQLKLYRQDHCFCTLYLGIKEQAALVYHASSGRGTSLRDQMMRDADSLTYFKSFGAPLKPSHWLDTLEVDYNPNQQVPSYAVVFPDGKYEINQRGRSAAAE